MAADSQSTVYRALRYPNWVRRGRILTKAFMRRKPSPDNSATGDSQGISINFIATFPADRAAWPEYVSGITQLNPCHGLLRLDAHNIDAIQLDQYRLKMLADTDNDTHGNITGLPYRDDDPVQAERLASLLRDCADVHALLTNEARDCWVK